MKDKLFKAIRGKCISDESARAVLEEVEKFYSAGEEVYVNCTAAEAVGRYYLYDDINTYFLKRIPRPTVSEEEEAKVRYDMAVEHWHSLTKNKLKGKDESERQVEIVATFIECLKIAAGL